MKMIKKGNTYLAQTTAGAFYLGVVTRKTKTYITMEKVYFVGDMGTCETFFKKGIFKWGELVNEEVNVPVASTVFLPWNHEIPTCKTVGSKKDGVPDLELV